MGDTVTETKLRFWKGIAVGAFLIGGACEWCRSRIITHEETMAKTDTALAALINTVHGHEIRIRTVEVRVGTNGEKPR